MLWTFLLWNIWMGKSRDFPLGIVLIGFFEQSCIEVALEDSSELLVGERF